MTSLSAFARSRDVEPKAVSIYMKRHKMTYNKNTGLTDEQIKILDEVYPVPKPVVVINGLDPDEERKLREQLEKTQSLLVSTQQKVIDLSEKVNFLQLESQKTQLLLEEIQSRSLLQRIFNKKIKEE